MRNDVMAWNRIHLPDDEVESSKRQSDLASDERQSSAPAAKKPSPNGSIWKNEDVNFFWRSKSNFWEDQIKMPSSPTKVMSTCQRVNTTKKRRMKGWPPRKGVEEVELTRLKSPESTAPVTRSVAAAM